MRGKKRGFPKALLFLGPGMLAAMADNDAGGIISYTVTGTKFGWSVFIPLTFCLVLVTYTVQEMAMRLGVAAGSGYTHLLKVYYGRGWMVFQVAALFVENLITLVTEFIGMSAGLSLIGIPHTASVILSAALIMSIAVLSGYDAKEKFGLVIGLLNLFFIIFAFFTKPNVSISKSIALSSGSDFRWYSAALIGNAVAPWMIFYQNSAYADKGVKSQYIKAGRADTIAGCICQVAVAAALIWIGASVYGKIPDIETAGPLEIVSALSDKYGAAAGVLFALGLFNSGLLASITVSLSSSWSVAEAFGWAKSLNDKISEAPGFYGVYFFSICIAAAAVMFPNLPLNFTAVFAQVAGAILMAPVLLFLTLITSKKSVMGEYSNSGNQKIRAWICVLILIIVSVFTFLRIVL